MHEFKLPDPGEGLLEADIVSWKVAVGDTVAVNDVLVEIETAKSLVELPSPYAGVIAEILVAEGRTVDVGTPIIRIADTADEAAAPAASVPSAAPAAAGAPTSAPAGAAPVPAGESREAFLVGYGARSGAVSRRQRKAAPEAAAPARPAAPAAPVRPAPAAPAARTVSAPSPVSASSSASAPSPASASSPSPAPAAPRAKPPVRRVARDLGIDLAAVQPTGPGGTVTIDDVVAAAGGTGEKRIPLKGVRKQMFRSMTASLAVPQATAFVEVDVTATMELIDTLKRRRDFTGLKISPLAIFAKAACLAIERVPEINSSYDAERDEVVLHDDVNLGIAAATPRGLLVPNIKAADKLNLLELTAAINELVPLARTGKVPPSALSGGTFSITNVGVFGVDGGTPIPNTGEAAIMCLGTILRKPWVVGTGENEHIEPRSVCTVTITFDHRLVDGEMGSKFLADVSTIMSDPALALLF
ncbi:MAG: dihydrolipoamide acetyltransferase family protein [Propionicimonas sp.]|uniref:dihydrolipoamide acetyltransferase family protein n=1 Tax=Propionicimonas sp. TaxID=1955623 RepID=UPI003D0AC0AF